MDLKDIVNVSQVAGGSYINRDPLYVRVYYRAWDYDKGREAVQGFRCLRRAVAPW